MGNVFEFPSQQAQGLAFLDRQLRELLTARGADEPLIDFATDQLIRIYSHINESEQYSFAVDLPEGLPDTQKNALQVQINAGLEGIRKENHSLMLKLVAQLVLAEVRLFQQHRD